MKFGKKFFKAAFTSALLAFLPEMSLGALVKISGNGSQDAIDTLTFSGSALFRGRATAAGPDTIIFNTFVGDSPRVVRDRIVAGSGSLINFTVSGVGDPNIFLVDTEPPGGPVTIRLNGQEVTSDSESSPFSKGGQRFRLTASQIPTFSEWGLIIFATLLLASLVWFIWRKRKLPKASA